MERRKFMVNEEYKMNPTIGVILLVAGVWLVSNAMIMKTKNIPSSLIFKVLPFFIGMACLWAGAKWFSWV
jgi:hypothetical protein